MGAAARKYKGWKAGTRVWVRISTTVQIFNPNFWNSSGPKFEYHIGVLVSDYGAKQPPLGPFNVQPWLRHHHRFPVLVQNQIKWIPAMDLVPLKTEAPDPLSAFIKYWSNP